MITLQKGFLHQLIYLIQVKLPNSGMVVQIGHDPRSIQNE